MGTQTGSLVNAHTHLEQSWLAPYCPDAAGIAFPAWAAYTLERGKRAVGDQREAAIRKGIEDGIAMLIEAGIAQVGDISSTGWSIAPLLESGLGGIVWLEVMAFTPTMGEEQFSRAVALIEQWRPLERNGLRIGLTLHTPYSVLPEYWQRGLDYARAEALPLCIHVAESREEYTWFMEGTGPIGDIQRRRGTTFDPPFCSPIRYLDESGALDLKPLLVHAVHVDDEDIARIQRSGSAVVHCPRSNLRLRCGRMPLEKYLAAGVHVLMGTDSLGSSPSLDVRGEIEIAVALHWGRVEPEVITGLAYSIL